MKLTRSLFKISQYKEYKMNHSNLIETKELQFNSISKSKEMLKTLKMVQQSQTRITNEGAKICSSEKETSSRLLQTSLI